MSAEADKRKIIKNGEICMDRKKIIIGIGGILLLSVIIILVIVKIRNDEFVLDKIYSVYPEEVRSLYQNIVDVDCNGDMYFDIEMDKEYNVNELDNKYLFTYMFSYLDKNKLLDKIDMDTIRDIESNLFYGNIDIDINNYSYGNYIYNVSDDNIITKDKYECVKSNNYVSYLYSYMYDYNGLYIDVSIGYEKDGKLYNFDNEELGSYDGDKSKLTSLMNNASYYRLYYVKKNDMFKLSKIKWMSLAE